MPERVELHNVPFYPQMENQCGPAALSMVFAYDGKAVTPSDLAEKVYLPGRKGSLQVEMLAATRREGLLPYVLTDRPDALLEELAMGHPVVVLQNVRTDIFPEWHYAVAIGYDLAKQEIMLHSGTTNRMVMALQDFDRTWVKSDRWAFVAMPPHQLPASAEESRFVESAVELEQVSPESARIAYEAALAKWPDNLLVRLGLGNIAYGKHQLREAETEYRKATVAHPDSGDAWNNLAQALHEQGRLQEALMAIHHALSIGGNRIGIYDSTMGAIQKDMAAAVR
jgi:tetratricopeptide (TPR) repeat protein